MTPAKSHKGPGIQLDQGTDLKAGDVNFVGFKHASIYADGATSLNITVDGCRMAETTGRYSSIYTKSQGASINITNSLFENNIQEIPGAVHLSLAKISSSANAHLEITEQEMWVVHYMLTEEVAYS